MLNFFLAMKIPSVTAQVKRCRVIHGKPIFFDGARIKAARQEFMLRLAGHKPREPIPKDTPISLFVRFTYRATKQHPEFSWKTTRPDTDNMIKLLKDCMTQAGFWQDDSQVASEHIEKRYGTHEGISIAIEPMAKVTK